MADAMNPNDNKPGTEQGHKFDNGKEMFDLVPVKPLIMLARLFTKGAGKYGGRNWERGIAFSRLYAAMFRHMLKWWGGEKYDPIDGQHHLDAVIWNAMALRELEETKPECDDREPQNKRFTDSETMYNG